jgi:hypothetical protein
MTLDLAFVLVQALLRAKLFECKSVTNEAEGAITQITALGAGNPSVLQGLWRQHCRDNSLNADLFCNHHTIGYCSDMSDLGGPRSCVGSFGHPNSTRLAAIGVLVCKAVCSRSDPRKAEHPPAARANWLNYRVANHLHQLSYRQHENTSAPSVISRGVAVTAELTASRTGGITHAALICG